LRIILETATTLRHMPVTTNYLVVFITAE